MVKHWTQQMNHARDREFCIALFAEGDTCDYIPFTVGNLSAWLAPTPPEETTSLMK